LTPAEFNALLGMLDKPYKTMVMTIACLGLRISELVALQWGDLDFEIFTVQVVRGFVRGVVNPTKTDASEGILPLDADLAELLLAHKRRTTCVSDCDYVFANESGNVRWPESMFTDHIKPAGAKPESATLAGTPTRPCFMHSAPSQRSKRSCCAMPTFK
jgi:integrase